MRAFRTVASSALRRGATAASVGSSLLDRTAALLRRAAGETPTPSEVGVEHRGGFTVVEPTQPQPQSQPQVPRAAARISNPKAARAVRKREKATTVTRSDVPGETRRGGRPVTVEAENTPSERAKSRAGRQAAPMGARDDAK